MNQNTKDNENILSQLSSSNEESQKSVRISFKKKRLISASRYQTLKGYISDVSLNRLVEFESSLERDFIYLLEFDTNVKSYYEQPLTLIYNDGIKNRTYTPDFLVEYWDEEPELIEIKYLADLKKNGNKYQLKFKASEEFCSFNKMSFKVKTEEDIRNDKLFNCRFLLMYKDRLKSIKENHILIVCQVLKSFGKATPSEIINKASNDPEKKLELIYVIWVLVANYIISFNFKKRLTMNSLLWMNQE